MQAKDYTAFDAELLRCVAGGNNRFPGLVTSLEQHAQQFAAGTKPEPFRIVDRRLQALRKAGKLRCNRIERAWEIVQKEGV